MKYFSKSCFNMLEIALAIAIIAIGATSIMALFPIGMSSTNATVADDNIPDAAEALLGYMEGRIQANWRDTVGEKKTNTFLTSLTTANPMNTVLASDGSFDDVDSGSDNLGLFVYNGNNSIFKFEKYYWMGTGLSRTRYTDFSAIIQVWREEPVYYFPSKYTFTTANQDDVRENHTVICMEISWPGDRNYSEREKRLYKMELYNQAYKP